MLGKALGIPENSIRTYAEAEIRAGYGNIYLSDEFPDNVALYVCEILLVKLHGENHITCV